MKTKFTFIDYCLKHFMYITGLVILIAFAIFAFIENYTHLGHITIEVCLIILIGMVANYGDVKQKIRVWETGILY